MTFEEIVEFLNAGLHTAKSSAWTKYTPINRTQLGASGASASAERFLSAQADRFPAGPESVIAGAKRDEKNRPLRSE